MTHQAQLLLQLIIPAASCRAWACHRLLFNTYAAIQSHLLLPYQLFPVTMDDGGAVSKTAAPSAGPAQGQMKQRKSRGNLRKRASEDTEEPEQDNTAVVRKAKQQKADPLSFSTKKERETDVCVTYTSTGAALAARDDTATRALETETEFDRDARAQREKLLAASAQGPASDGKYRGINSYVDYKAGLRREGLTVGSEKGGGAHGPVRGNVFVRTTAR
eukprot:GHRR01021105.1.p1 GENE.GHRR01021105.1~~GHRR01021105.1.p1  ORF type:complete len:218 (+),score=38.38 GHRR01021105.1:63-716(+)